MFGPYPTEAVIQALQTLPALLIVGGVADLETARQQPPRNAPAAYVLREEKGQGFGDYAEHHRQRILVTVKVILWVRHAGTADSGAKAEAEMTTVENAVRSQLFGFSPTGTAPYEPLVLAYSGNDTYFGNHLLREVHFAGAYTAGGTP